MTTFRAAALLVLLALVAAGCSSGAASGAPASPTLAPRPSVPPSITGTPPVTSQTDTDWGRIWDTLPSTFPTVSGASPGEETATGPASADLVVDGLDAKAVVTALETQLEGRRLHDRRSVGTARERRLQPGHDRSGDRLQGPGSARRRPAA